MKQLKTNSRVLQQRPNGLGEIINLMDLVSGEKDLTSGRESAAEPRGELRSHAGLKVSSLPLTFFNLFLWLRNLMSLASSHSLFMQENKEENAAPPKSVNCN